MKILAISFSLAMVLLPGSIRAQEEGGRKRIRVLPAPGGQPAKDRPDEEIPVKSGTVQLAFGPTSDVKDVLALYGQLVDHHILYTNVVVGPCPVVTPERVTKEKAISLIESALFANGFCLVDSPDGTVQVTGIGQSTSTFPIPVYTKLEELPKRERIAKMVFKIRNRDVVQLAMQMLTAYPPAPYMQGLTCIADPKSQTLVVTERTSTIREIAKLLEQLDVVSDPKQAPK